MMTRNKFVTPGFSCFNCPSSTAASPSTSSWPTSTRPSVGQRQYSVQSRRYTVHYTLHTAYYTLHTSHCTLQLHTAHSALHTALCILQLQSTLQVYCAVVDKWPSSTTPGARYLTRLYLVLHNCIKQSCNRQFRDYDCTNNSVSLSPILGYFVNRRIIRTVPAMPLQGDVIVYIVCRKGAYGSLHDPIQYCAAILPACKYDPAGLGAGTMTVKTTSQGVVHSQIWSLSGGLWPGDGSSKKVRGGVTKVANERYLPYLQLCGKAFL